ncbi:hypothetical protein ACH4TV_12950 [Streptomyces sp. NPDC020898]|uniref:hypothetical protein n=1 Tax=Streptomyces sp. NPDC020898 TaxID=3365101 RepID=UPI00379FD5F9
MEGAINTVDGGVVLAERFGLDPVVEVGEGDRAVPTPRHPIRFSETPAAYSGRRGGRRPPAGRPGPRPSGARDSEVQGWCS